MSLLLFRPLELIEFGLLLTEAVSREGKKATLGLSKKMIFSMVQLIGKWITSKKEKASKP